MSLIFSVFDPLGLPSPLIIKGRIFIQTLWKEEMSCDQPLSQEKVKVVEEILKDLQRVGEFLFPQLVVFTSIEFHVFVDASSKAYGAVVYIVDRDSESIDLLISKARIALCQEWRLTIPKLELTAALIGCRLLNHLNSLFSVCRFYLWSDSKVALSWIKSDKDLNDVYLANRVAKIQVLTVDLGIQLLYVPTTENPADLLSRGCSVEKLKSSNWMHGPDWLITREYPNQDTNKVVVNELVVEINPVAPIPPILDLSRFSKFTKVIRVMSKILQFLTLKVWESFRKDAT